MKCSKCSKCSRRGVFEQILVDPSPTCGLPRSRTPCCTCCTCCTTPSGQQSGSDLGQHHGRVDWAPRVEPRHISHSGGHPGDPRGLGSPIPSPAGCTGRGSAAPDRQLRRLSRGGGSPHGEPRDEPRAAVGTFHKRGVWNTAQHLTFPRCGSCSINVYSVHGLDFRLHPYQSAAPGGGPGHGSPVSGALTPEGRRAFKQHLQGLPGGREIWRKRVAKPGPRSTG